MESSIKLRSLFFKMARRPGGTLGLAVLGAMILSQQFGFSSRSENGFLDRQALAQIEECPMRIHDFSLKSHRKTTVVLNAKSFCAPGLGRKAKLEEVVLKWGLSTASPGSLTAEQAIYVEGATPSQGRVMFITPHSNALNLRGSRFIYWDLATNELRSPEGFYLAVR